MKVLLIHTYYRYKGGEDMVVESELQLLREGGMELALLAFRNPESKIKALLALFFLPFNLFSFLKTIRKIRAFQPDVVHLHNWHFAASPSVLVACHWFNIPVVCTLHNFRLLCPSATLFHQNQLFLDSLSQRFPWRAVSLGVYRNSRLQSFWLAFSVYLHKILGTWKKVGYYIVFSEFGKKVFLNSNLGVPAEKFWIKPNSIPDPSYQPDISRNGHFLFIGRLVEEKGIEVLLKAFSKTHLQLTIYGYGPMETEVKAFAAKHPHIQYAGSLPHDQVAATMQQCSALIFPSIWYEGMPITLLEAMATGTPVIASKIGSMAGMIQDQTTGLHFASGDHEDLLQKLHDWETLDREDKTLFCQNARALYTQKYTQQINQKALKSLYQRAKKP